MVSILLNSDVITLMVSTGIFPVILPQSTLKYARAGLSTSLNLSKLVFKQIRYTSGTLVFIIILFPKFYKWVFSFVSHNYHNCQCSLITHDWYLAPVKGEGISLFYSTSFVMTQFGPISRKDMDWTNILTGQTNGVTRTNVLWTFVSDNVNFSQNVKIILFF